MGKGKGSLDHWVSVVKPGRILFEIEGVDREMAEEALGMQVINCQLKLN